MVNGVLSRCGCGTKGGVEPEIRLYGTTFAAMATLKEKAASGLFWGAVGSGGMQILNLLIGIFLARLLSPADYGVVGMIAIFTAIAGNLQDSGFTQALINSRGDERRDCNSVFWFNVFVSLLMYLILFMAAPLIAGYFNQPCLVWLSRFVFLAFVFAALGIVPGAIMSKRLMVREKTQVMVIALLVSGVVGIVMAFNGKAYWSLACQQVLYVLVVMLGRYYYVRWRPQLRIDLEPVRRMFGFSWKVLVTSVLTSVNTHVLTVILGGRFASHIVGYYTQASKWGNMASSLVTTTITQVAQPVFVQAGQERERQLRVFRKMLRFTAFLSFPAMFGLALVAQEFIVLLLGDKWVPSVYILRILCVGMAFLPLYAVYQNLFLSRGASGVYMCLSAVQMLLQIGAILYFSSLGVFAMVIAYAAVIPVCLLFWQTAAHRVVGLSWRSLFLDIAPFFCVALFAMGVVYLLTTWIHTDIVLLSVRILLAVLIYGGVLWLLHAKILKECVDYFLKRKVDTCARE